MAHKPTLEVEGGLEEVVGRLGGELSSLDEDFCPSDRVQPAEKAEVEEDPVKFNIVLYDCCTIIIINNKTTNVVLLFMLVLLVMLVVVVVA
mmetsp:Transcript_26845/g.39261  ORF Transcript_26845/g.39261 Transcript_26845/m.39261 type:complete len:91 (-) Transcript_26845:32-304(-)